MFRERCRAVWLRALTISVSVSVAGLGLAGCAHGVITELPTAPGATIVALTITPAGGASMLAGESAPITSSGPLTDTGPVLGAFAQYRDGSGKYVPATWTSSDANVIRVDGTSFMAIGRGTVTITASAEGRTARETFLVEPRSEGNWSGTFVVDRCLANSGSMAELICMSPDQGRAPGLFPIGAAPPLTLQIARAGTELTAVAQFGDLRGTLTGIDRGSNLFTLKGDLTANRTTIAVGYWDALVRTDAMEGFISFEVRVEGVPGLAVVDAHLDKVTRN
jgi:hypothetical protein